MDLPSALDPRTELFRWYCVADVVGVPSYNESFGLVALEAQACGRPVVATDVGGLRHTVRRPGRPAVLVPGQDVEAVGRRARHAVLDDEDRTASGWAPRRRRTPRRFSWDNTAAATLAAYGVALDSCG